MQNPSLAARPGTQDSLSSIRTTAACICRKCWFWILISFCVSCIFFFWTNWVSCIFYRFDALYLGLLLSRPVSWNSLNLSSTCSLCLFRKESKCVVIISTIQATTEARGGRKIDLLTASFFFYSF